ncbi:urease accessory protein UreF [Paramylibacter ulvae]|nr:urease accessory protein UreF [Amylibacter ulvae]
MSTSSAHKLMAWLSPSYPIGAYSYSHGLEYAIDAGDVHDADSLQIWLSDVLQYGAGRNDAILLAHAYRAAGDALEALSDLAIALSPSVERHLETTAQGAAFSKVTSAVTGREISAMPLPVALGVAARAERISLDDLIPLYLHSFAANIIAAGVRFIPLGQTDGQRVLHALFDQIDDIAKQAETASLDDLGSACFLSDIASMKHENMTTRIFRT